MEITAQVAIRVLTVVDRGLCKGVGKPTPGKKCIEAAVCYALGDQPGVAPALRRFNIGLNDAWSSNETRTKGLRRIAIAQLGTAGTLNERLFAEKLSKAVVTKLLPKALRSAAALQQEPHKSKLLEAANRCETEGTSAAAYAARAAADSAAYAANAADSANAAAYAAADSAYAANAADSAAYAAAYAAADSAAYAAAYAARAAADSANAAADQLLSEFAEEVVQILVEMKTPGSSFLYLTQ
jgi:hypothetical protein